ncbi:MAG: KH domain-containing protein [Methanobrevibacter sp.]|nr:KH domain-containing protein [Candidatus Methanovirga aequatorialis]
MVSTNYLKIPQKRIGALIGSNGEIKKKIENLTQTVLDVDSNEGTVTISPREDMEDPLGVWKTNNIVKAIGRGFSPEVAFSLNEDDVYLEVIKLTSYLGKSKKALARYKGRIIGRDGKTRDIIIEMAEVSLAVFGKTVSIIGTIDGILMAKEAIEMILHGSRHKSVYSFLEHKHQDRKIKEFRNMVGLENEEKIEFRTDNV